MSIVWIIIAGLLMLAGLIGCVIPIIPGVPLAYAGFLVLQLSDKAHFSTSFILILAGITIIVQVLDYFVPSWGTKKMGGSKWGVWGATIGTIVGLFTGIVGVLIGPFIGAAIAEWCYIKTHPTHTRSSDLGHALKAGWGTFIGLFAGIILKLICCGMMIYYLFQVVLS